MKNEIRRWDSILFKFIASTAVAALLIFGLLIAFHNNRVGHNISIYNDRVAERQTSFRNITDLESQSLESLTFENTYWDQMVAFIDEGDPKFEEEVLLAQLTSYEADIMWTYGKDYNLVSNTNELPSESKDFNLNLMQSDLDKIFKYGFKTHFFRNTEMGIVEVYGATVHPSADIEHKSTPQGYFFVARIIDKDHLKNLEASTNDRISLLTGVRQIPPLKSDPKAGVINFREDLRDENRKLIAQLDVGYTAKAIAELFRSLDRVFIFSMAFLTFICVSFVLLLRRMIVAPMTKIYKALLTDNTKALDTLSKNKSEIGHVADLINKSIKQKQIIAQNNARIAKDQKALEARNNEIEKINKLMIDRELRMIELKTKLNSLKIKQ